MEISKKSFQKKSNYQLGRSPEMGLPQPCIAPWAWPLPKHGVWGHPSLELILIGRFYTKDPAPTLHEDLPTEGKCDNTEVLWQLRQGQPPNLVPHFAGGHLPLSLQHSPPSPCLSGHMSTGAEYEETAQLRDCCMTWETARCGGNDQILIIFTTVV